jgi:capsular polysaccharide biosynthesis protein
MLDILNRGRQRAGRLFRELLPHHEHYRPLGVHPSSRGLAARNSSGATYTEVYPAHPSFLGVPNDLYALTTDYGGLHAKPNRIEQVPPAFVLALTQGRLLADNHLSVATISADNRLVGDASFQYDAQRSDLARPEENNVFAQRWFTEPCRITGTVASLLSGGGAAVGNYYHWLIDSLPRLHLLQQAGYWDSIDYFLVYNREQRFVMDSLRAAGVRPEQVLDLSTHCHFVADRLLVTSPVRGTGTHTPPWACEFLRHELRPPGPKASFGPYVYLSRRDAPARHVLNEPAVEALLRPYGFETHVLSHYSFAQQQALFAGARAVVAPTGAGLANLVFAPAGTPVIELFPKHFTVIEYPELCYRLGLPHRYMVAEAANGPLHARRDGWREDLTVDLDTLRTYLDQALCARPVPPAGVFASSS